MLKKNDPDVIQAASLMAIGELLDELICLQQDRPVDEQHQNFGRKLTFHLDWMMKGRKSS